MAHVYTVKLTNGDVYTVTTNEHHEDHHQPAWFKFLADALREAGVRITSDMIVHFVYKGRK